VPVSVYPDDSNVEVLGCTSNAVAAKVSQSVEANLTTKSSDEVRSRVKTANCVFVVSQERKPLTPCTAARARQLLRDKRAAVLRRYPFTIILRGPTKTGSEIAQETEVRLDPGAKTTGIALVRKNENRVIWAAELEHRGSAIKSSLESRRSIRRGRRARHAPYREARFDNRSRPKGWLPPSLEHRVLTTMTWVGRLQRFSPVASLAVERVKFDMQKMTNPEISGVEYQQGELQGYEVREYLLEKFSRKCAYCGAENIPLEVEHVVPRSRGGSDKVSNLTLACRSCNEKKGTKLIEEFLAKKPEILKKIKSQLKKPLDAAAAVNSTRNRLLKSLLDTYLPIKTGTGAQTKFNRVRGNCPKAHWIDAACVGDDGFGVSLDENLSVLSIKSTGHGSRQMCITDKYGFPKGHKENKKSHFGFQTGDMVVSVVTKGKKVGRYIGRVAVRKSGSFKIKTQNGAIDGISHKTCKKIHSCDGYEYKNNLINTEAAIPPRLKRRGFLAEKR
jgi:5-methylcytosine-specific restriction endonuclease McrA